MQYVTTAGAQGICPPGWHIPTLAEFTTLQTTVGGSTQGNTLKAIGQGTTIGAGTNTSGFSALLAGYRDLPGTFFYITFGGYFWSSTENNPTPTLALNGNLLYSNSNFVFTYSAKEYGFNVRCLKD